VALLAHSFRVLQSGLWSYIPIIVACILEIIGYVFRYESSQVDPYRISYFVIQYFCITVAPVFIAASIYVYLSNLATWAAEVGYPTGLAGRLGRKALLWIFISADTLCTALQVTGAALIGSKTSKHKDPTDANRILIIGLGIQTFAFSIFLLLLAHLLFSMSTARATMHGQIRLMAIKAGFALTFAGVLVFLRTVFRLVESAQGVFGFLSSHEVFFGTLEFAPIAVAVALLAIFTPALLHFSEGSSDRRRLGSKDRGPMEMM
jgi:hypothetical protein